MTHLAPIFVEFVHGVVLREPDSSMNTFGQKMNFRGRFARRAEPSMLASLQSEFEYLVVAGFGLHYLLTEFPTRNLVGRVDTLHLQEEWIGRAIAADHSLRWYDAEQHGIPSRFVEHLYRTRLERLLRDSLRLGFWKEGQARSYIKNLFWSGVLLGLAADLQTKSNPAGP